MPLLTAIEGLINDYLIFPKWPHLHFKFSAKSPKEDARAYELKVLSLTVDERRALSDRGTLEDSVEDPTAKEIARIMGSAPCDPGLVGAFQSIATAIIAAKNAAKEAESTPGAAFPAKKDPAASEEHGHMSGVRRDSAAEKESAEA
jgi:hypothetical protein